MARFTREAGFTLMELIIVTAIVAMIAAAILGVYQVSQAIYIRSASLEDAQLSARAGLDRIAIELRLAGAYLSGAATALDPAPDAITAASSTSVTFGGDVNGDTLNSCENEIEVKTLYSSGTSLVVGWARGPDGTNPFAANKYIYVLNGVRREIGQIASTSTSGTTPSGTLCTAINGTTFTLTLVATLPAAAPTHALKYDYPAGSIVRTVETVMYTFNSGTGTLTRSVDGGLADTIVSNVTGFTLTYYRICLSGTTICGTDTDATCPFHPTALGTPAPLPDPVSAACLAKIPQYKSVLSGLEIQISLTTQGNDGSRRTMTSRVRPRSLGVLQE